MENVWGAVKKEVVRPGRHESLAEEVIFSWDLKGTKEKRAFRAEEQLKARIDFKE